MSASFLVSSRLPPAIEFWLDGRISIPIIAFREFLAIVRDAI
jgi:hypothetical protein